MKITMLDTVETAHTMIPDLEKGSVKAQDGLQVISEQLAVAGGLTGICYVARITKGVTVDLPARLARHLVDIGHAKEGAA